MFPDKTALSFFSFSFLFDKNRIRSIITSTTVSYIEYDYWYRQQYPNAGIMAPIPSYIGKNAEVSLEYTIWDINERLMDGTPASRGEFLGECLFDICLDIAIGKAVKQCADSIDAAKAVDDLDDIKTRYTTAGNIGNAAPKDVDDVFLDGKKHSITVKSTNTKLFNNLIKEYGDNMSNVKNAVVQRFKEICNERNIKPNELANLSGVTPSTVYSLFSEDRKNVSITTIKILCDGLDITLGQFFGNVSLCTLGNFLSSLNFKYKKSLTLLSAECKALLHTSNCAGKPFAHIHTLNSL